MTAAVEKGNQQQLQKVDAVRVAMFIHSQAQQQKWRLHVEQTSLDSASLIIQREICFVFTYCCEVFLKWAKIYFSFWRSRYRTAKQTRNRVQLLVRKQTNLI